MRRDGSYTNRWVTFIYDDPSKDDADLKNTVKTVLTKILGLEVVSLYKDRLDSIDNGNGNYERLTVNYVTATNHGDDNVELEPYVVKLKESHGREIKYENIPAEVAQQIIHSTDMDGFSKKTVMVQVNEGLKFKYVYTIDEDHVSLDLEEVNCYTIEMEDDEIETMHNPENVLHNMREVITQFLNN